MTRATKMMMIRSAGDNASSYNRNEMRGRDVGMRGGYDDMRGNYGDMRRGYGQNNMRGGYDEAESRGNYGRYEMRNDMRGDMDDEMDGAFRDRRGRRHYDNGRFAPMRGEMENNMDSGDQWRIDWERSRAANEPREVMGFRAGNVIDFPHGNEMEHRHSGVEMGKASGSQKKLDKHTTEKWMEQMQNEDGSSGPHWTREQVQQLMSQRKMTHDPLEFWAALNVMYSDYCKVAKKNGINTMDFYIDMAEAFLNDKDAKGDKLSKYYFGVVQG